MHILIMAQHYAPEDVSGAVLATQLAEDWVRRQHQVTFVTAAPSYPAGRVFAGYKNSFLSTDTRNGVHIVRTWSYITPSKAPLNRLLNYGTFSMTAALGGLWARRADVVYSYSPPLTLCLSAWFVSRMHRAPWILRVEDLYPDAAVAAGVITQPSVIRALQAIEYFAYRHAAHVSLISETFRQRLLEKGVSSSKLSVMPVWADPDDVRPMPKENGFREEHHLNGKFIVLYAGNLGITSSLEDVLVAAEQTKHDNDLHWVIVGEGIKRKELIQHAQAKHLQNVLFLSYQPRHRLSEMMAAADISLVTLNAASASFSLPSKVFTIMASGRPILAISPVGSELERVVQTHQCGWNIPPGDGEALSQRVLWCKSHPDQLAEAGGPGGARPRA
ncbi:MAG: glycosyltransferase family 4 protein, partial [Candidatus Hadarchaeum sp.]